MTETSKPMSGWRRLWIVASILTGAPIFIAAYESYNDYEHIPDVPLYEAHATASAALGKMSCQRGPWSWTSASVYPERTVMRKVVPTVTGDPPPNNYNAPKELWGKVVEQRLLNLSLTCTGKTPQWWWWFAFLPAVLMAAVGLTSRWIYRGFRPTATGAAPKELHEA